MAPHTSNRLGTSQSHAGQHVCGGEMDKRKQRKARTQTQSHTMSGAIRTGKKKGSHRGQANTHTHTHTHTHTQAQSNRCDKEMQVSKRVGEGESFCIRQHRGDVSSTKGGTSRKNGGNSFLLLLRKHPGEHNVELDAQVTETPRSP